jgi:hypothetical protein
MIDDGRDSGQIDQITINPTIPDVFIDRENLPSMSDRRDVVKSDYFYKL